MTPERFERISQVLATRQPDLTVCLERIHKPNNVSAIIRTADAVGVHKVHAVWQAEQLRLHSHTSAGSRNWVELETHANIADAVHAMKAQGMQVLATNLSERAVDFREIDYTKPTAIILGGEKHGITAGNFSPCRSRYHYSNGGHGTVVKCFGSQCLDSV